MVHQADMVIGVGVPRSVGLERPRGLAGVGIAQIGDDDAVFVLELLHRVEGMGLETCDRRVQPAARDDHQREAGADLLVVDANIASFVERHVSSSLLVMS